MDGIAVQKPSRGVQILAFYFIIGNAALLAANVLLQEKLLPYAKHHLLGEYIVVLGRIWGLLAVARIICALGLLKLKEWGRYGLIVISVCYILVKLGALPFRYQHISTTFSDKRLMIEKQVLMVEALPTICVESFFIWFLMKRSTRKQFKEERSG